MNSRILFTALATVTAIGLSAPAAAAQQGTRVTNRAPRVVATYSFGAKRRDIAFPSTVIVADSAGTLVATAQLAGESTVIPMTVTVIDDDLVLQGKTTDGVLTLVLDKQANSAQARVTNGRWSVGTAEGKLRARN